MPKICQVTKTTSRRTKLNNVTMAVRLMGNRSTKTFSHCSEIVEICGGRSGLLYKMDRSEATCNDNIKQHSKVSLEIHYMQIVNLGQFILIFHSITDIFVFRFGLLAILIFDNGRKFNNNNFMDFCMSLGDKAEVYVG